MGRFGLVGPSYTSQSLLADCQMTMNWYLEAIESGVGRSAMALYPTPGLGLLWNLGPEPVRGIQTVQGRTFVVAGTQLFELFTPNANPNFKNWSQQLGVDGVNVVSDGNPVSMVGGGHQLLLASAGKAYVFDLSANTLTPVDPSAGANLPIAVVSFVDSFFFALVENAAPVPWQINSSNSFDATTWQGTNFAEVENFTNNPISLYANARLLWVQSPTQTQPYDNADDFPFPFDPIPGTQIETGIAAPFSIARLDNSIFWLGSDERGNGVVWRANGFTPGRVSNHAIEFALQSYKTIADAVAYAYQDQGHSFYVISFPTANKTWVYDAATQEWHERGFWNQQAGVFTRHRAAYHTFNFGMHIVGDYSVGACYQMAVSIPTDFGNAIRRVRRAPHISKEQTYITHSRVQLDAEVGNAAVPPLQGNAPPTFLQMVDAANATRNLCVGENGVLQAPLAITPGVPGEIFMNDAMGATSWQIVIAATGMVQALPVAFDASYPQTLIFVSLLGQQRWVLSLTNLGNNVAQLVVTLIGIVGRGPIWILKWSNDGALEFNQGLARDGGQAGRFRTRLLWNRLGVARDRVYEISICEPVSSRIIDAYLEADGYEPSERLAKEALKQA